MKRGWQTHGWTPYRHDKSLHIACPAHFILSCGRPARLVTIYYSRGSRGTKLAVSVLAALKERTGLSRLFLLLNQKGVSLAQVCFGPVRRRTQPHELRGWLARSGDVAGRNERPARRAMMIRGRRRSVVVRCRYWTTVESLPACGLGGQPSLFTPFCRRLSRLLSFFLSLSGVVASRRQKSRFVP